MPMWLSLDEISTLLDRRQARRRRWIEERGLASVEVGGRSLVNKTDLLEWALANGVAVDPEIFRWEREGALAIRLSEALAAGSARSGLRASDGASAVLAVLDGLPVPGRIDREGLTSLMQASGSRAFLHAGDGLYVPGPKSPLVLPVERPALAVGTFAGPVELGGDRPPMARLCLLASRTIREHLKMLARLSQLLADPGLRVELARSTEPRAAFARFEDHSSPAANGRAWGAETR
jgi:mannitol/fructose-specific phosphotransferase system IIA component (Ntr-type)